MKNHRLKSWLFSSCSVRKDSPHPAHPPIRHPEVCRNAMLLTLPALVFTGCFQSESPSEEIMRHFRDDEDFAHLECGPTVDCISPREEYQIYIPGSGGEPVESTVMCMAYPADLIWSWAEECGLKCSLTSLTLDDQSSELVQLSRQQLLEQHPKELYVEVSWDLQNLDSEITEEELLECLEKTFLAYLPVEKVTIKTEMLPTEE